MWHIFSNNLRIHLPDTSNICDVYWSNSKTFAVNFFYSYPVGTEIFFVFCFAEPIPECDVELWNKDFMQRSEELYDALMSCQWEPLDSVESSIPPVSWWCLIFHPLLTPLFYWNDFVLTEFNSCHLLKASLSSLSVLQTFNFTTLVIKSNCCNVLLWCSAEADWHNKSH